MKSEFLIAVTQLAAERNLPKETVLQAIEAALASAFKKDTTAAGYNINVRLNPATGEVKVYVLKTVVDHVTDPHKEMTLAEAKRLTANAKLSDTVETESPLLGAGRIAAQTAKQVVSQRLRDAERELVYEEFAAREGDILTGTIQRLDPRQITLDLGRTEGVLPPAEQVLSERYRPGQKMKVLLLEVHRASKGPEILVSRTHKNLLKRLFELEVPEIRNGVVEIKAIAREPGSRSKVAVSARQAGVDPVGSCVGLRGIRIQNIVNELQGEKIDVVQWHKDFPNFIANSLSPAQVLKVELVPEDQAARVIVPDKLLSLAIGKDGQNARLAAKLTGWRIDIVSSTEVGAERQRQLAEARALQAEAIAQAQPAVTPEPPSIPVPAEAAAAPASQVPVAKAPSPEEVLAALAVEEEIKPSEAPAEHIGLPPEVAFSDEIWRVAKPAAEATQVRFAEEIMPGRSVAKAKEKKGQRKEEEGTKPRKTGGRRIRYQEEVEEEP